MSLWTQFLSLFDKDRKEFVAVPIATNHTDATLAPASIEAGKTYFRLWVSQMFLHKLVQAAQTLYPAIHSVVKFDFGDHPGQEIPNIIDPSIGKLDGQDKVVVRNILLTPTAPFSGGTVAISAGLVSIVGTNHLNDFIGVFGKFAELLAVPQLSAALKIAQPLALGIQSLFSAGNGSLHLGWKQVFDNSDLKAGYVVVIRATEQDVNPERLWVVDKQLREGDTLPGSQPFDRFDFMLLRFDVFEERDDFDKLTYIEEPYQQALDALQGGDSEAVKKADFFLQTALRRVFKSPDLTQADRTRIILALKDRYKQAKEAFGTAGLVDRKIKFSKVVTSSMTAAAAFKMSEPTEDDLVDID